MMLGTMQIDALSTSNTIKFLPHHERLAIRSEFEQRGWFVLFISVENSSNSLHSLVYNAISSKTSLRFRNVGKSLQLAVEAIKQQGYAGLVLSIGDLNSRADAAGILNLDDGSTLSLWAHETQSLSCVLILDASNAKLSVHGPPSPLAQVLYSEAAMPIYDAVKPSPSSTFASSPKPNNTASFTLSELDANCSILSSVSRSTALIKFEEIFAQAYIPIRTAIVEQHEIITPHLSTYRAACQHFEFVFSRMYQEAFQAFGSTGRYPTMTFELFDVVHQCARTHSARLTQIVLIDALRYDLAKRLWARLQSILINRAECVEEKILWSLLPTTTSVQLDALARGEDALRSPALTEREALIARARSLTTFRRIRVGHKDLVKLDLLEARLREQGPHEHERLNILADELTPVVAHYIESMPARTLIAITGDHGFTFDAIHTENEDSLATPPARQGGSSPNEVLIGLSLWLTKG